MAVRKTTQKKKTTKKVVKSASSGKFASKESAKIDKAGTVTQTVPVDKDGVRSDKGGTHKKRSSAPETEPVIEAHTEADPKQSEFWEEVQKLHAASDPALEAPEGVENTTAEPKEDFVETKDIKTEEEFLSPHEPETREVTASESLATQSTDGEASNAALEADSESVSERKPCLVRRPTKAPDYTCLDEQQEAVEHPERFTSAQYQAIINDENLCDNCREYNESVE